MEGKRQFGVVKYFNAHKGFGFIALNTQHGTKDVFVDNNGILSGSYEPLEENQSVSFLVVKGKKGLEAQDVRIEEAN